MDKKTVRKESEFDLLVRMYGRQNPSDGILEQESDGQSSFVNSDTLPTDIYGDGKSALEKAGVKFLGIVEGDEIFQYVELPDGWQKEKTGHSMHSQLLDDKGRERATIFYKAAIYDRSAHLSISRRYSYCADYKKEDTHDVIEAIATDCGKEIYRTPPVTSDDHDYPRDVARQNAEDWLREHFPDFEEASVYWD